MGCRTLCCSPHKPMPCACLAVHTPPMCWLRAPQALSVASDWRGMMVTAEPEVRIRPLINAADQFVVLACDGIWDVMTNMEVCDHFLGAGPFSSSGSVTRACERLLDLCLGRGSKDNMSVTLIVLDAWWCQQERACCDVS